jgi:hypothetical protein|tara:strand:- start:9 stop:344 length:336 start_codon:yes stop_codon:yes gene_type:complete
MAKVSKKPTASKKVTPVEAPAAKGLLAPPSRASGVRGQKIKLLTKVVENRKLPKQAQVVVETLEMLGGTATQGELIDALIEKGGLVTRQTPKRIYEFYRPRLLGDNYIEYV